MLGFCTGACAKVMFQATRNHCNNPSSFSGPILHAGQEKKNKSEAKMNTKNAESAEAMELPHYIQANCLGPSTVKTLQSKPMPNYNYAYHAYSFYDLKLNTEVLACAQKIKQAK